MSEKVNNQYLSKTQLSEKLKCARENRETQRKSEFYFHSKYHRISSRKKKLHTLIYEQAHRGDISAICNSLHSAYEGGHLSAKENTVTFVKTICNNLDKKVQGKRYDTYTQEVFEALTIIGGPRRQYKKASDEKKQNYLHSRGHSKTSKPYQICVHFPYER
jgi:uncharacterized membrane protein YheB (UPF0754 family)